MPTEGSKINRTYSKKLYEKVDDKIENYNFKRNLDLDLNINIGENPKINGKTEGFETNYELDKKVEVAKKSGLSREKVLENISKTGDSIFEVRSVDLNLDEGAFLPISAINEMRREVVKKLENKILESMQILD